MTPSPQKTSKRLGLRRPLLGALAFSLMLSSLGCGKKTKADGASFKTLPESPIVITADGHDSGGNKIKQPWFSLRVSASNDTGDTFTLIAIIFTVVGIDKQGMIKSTDFGFTPSDFVKTIVYGLESYSCTFTNFGTWKQGDADEVFTLRGDYFSYPVGGQDCDLGWVPVFYLGDNPSGPSGTSFVYTVKAKPMGWFGTFDEPTDRFETNFKFKTQ